MGLLAEEEQECDQWEFRRAVQVQTGVQQVPLSQYYLRPVFAAGIANPWQPVYSQKVLIDLQKPNYDP